MNLKLQNVSGVILLAVAATAVLYGLFARTSEQVKEVKVLSGTGVNGLPQAAVGGPMMLLPVAANVTADPQPAPMQTAAPATGVAPNYVGTRLQIYEAHWQGMDTLEFTEELRRKLKFPRGFNGILVGEVTMAAGRSGMLAGDVMVAVGGVPINSLAEFQRQTKVLRNRRQASVAVMRKGKQQKNGRYVMKQRNFVIQSDGVLGFAQVEAAPMIVAGDPPPHPYRGICTNCHAIGEGWELAPDPDLINLPPPMLSQVVVARGEPPHRDFGPCRACHIVVPRIVVP